MLCKDDMASLDFKSKKNNAKHIFPSFSSIFFFFFFFCEKHILVITFSGDSHFSSYILFLPLLVSILKNASRFGPYRYSFNRNILRGK